MYIERLQLVDFRGFERLTWTLARDECAGWHVLLGPNGAGKSTCLKAAAIALIGASQFEAARVPKRELIRRAEGVERARVELTLVPDEEWDEWGQEATSGNRKPADMLGRELIVELPANDYVRSPLDWQAELTIWGKQAGWFSAAFGPMRRLSGGSPESQRLFESFPRLARHLSILDEGIALAEVLGWLRQLRFQQLETQSDQVGGEAQLDQVRRFVNQPGFLPHGAKLGAVSSEVVEFKDGNGVTVSVLELSDGYRVVLALVFEVLRLMLKCYPARPLFSDDGYTVLAPGVILIDEVDAHLHPTWQRDIGPWLTRLFPRVQFIVTTHSPYVVQAATKGSVWTLPTPGGEGGIHRLRGEQLQRATLGDVLHVLNSEAFGGLPGRSEEANAQFDELARLNRLHAKGRISAEQDGLRLQLASKLGPLQSGSEG